MPRTLASADGAAPVEVDPVDWVERIPLSETRNYVQRVMENLLVYRVRFEDSTVAKSDQRVVTQETNAAPAAPVDAPSAVRYGSRAINFRPRQRRDHQI